jgi:glycosyltransferase involved in cell wall biosynthesis
MYAGFSGRGKEKFDSILKALDMLGDMKSRFELHVFGCSEEAFSAKLNDNQDLYKRVSDCITVRGRIPQEKVHAEYMNADFSVFMRPNLLSNNAGFPTKLAESMVAGTPVLCNNTGDIGLYLRNGHNGFLFDDASPEVIRTALVEIAGMSDEKRMEMRRQARLTAEKNFDYRNYTSQLCAFISDC